MSIEIIKNALNEQYGAAITMLKQNLKSCPKELWDDRTYGPPFWHVAYHAMWFLDWYLSDSRITRENFQSKFGDEVRHFEQLTANNIKDAVLTPKQLLEYLSEIKENAKNRFEKITLDDLSQPSVFDWHGNSVLSSLLYNIRHVMLHIGALNRRLHRKGVELDNWVRYRKI
jgi:hypothetical protein